MRRSHPPQERTPTHRGPLSARANGISWDRIGKILGISAQNAKEHYDPSLETLSVLSDPDTMTAGVEAENDFEAGRLSALD